MRQAIDEADGDRQQHVATPAQRLVDEGANAREIAPAQLGARHPIDVEDGDIGNSLIRHSHDHRPISQCHLRWAGAVWKDHRPSSLGWPSSDRLIPPHRDISPPSASQARRARLYTLLTPALP